MFDAGSLVFTIRAIGAAVFQQDMAGAEQAVTKTGKSASTSSDQVDGLGASTDKTAKKAKDSKGPLDEQAQSTKKTGDESEKASKKQDQQRQSTEQQIEAAKKLSAALTIAGVAVAALVTLAVAKNTEFDSAISNVRAATMATAEEQRQLGEAALEAGADTAYSAREAADAQEELAKAGQSVSQIIGGSLNGALALAAAGQLQVARSAEIMATTLTQFRLPAEQAAHVSDVLAAGAGKAQGSVDDLALALSYVGPLAGSVGLSLDETAGTIAYFATQGIIGERAGTSLRGVLASLQAPSAAADKEMQKYNISMFDGSGNMLSMAGIAEQLKTRLGGLTEQERLAALGRIFGNESLNAATLLYEGGADAVNEWTAAVDDTGFAAEQARIRQDNLAGDIEKLGGAFDTALIKTGSAANDTLRGMVQTITELVDMYSEAPAPIQETALVLGVAAAAVLLFAGGAVGARAKFLELQLALEKTNFSMGKTAIIGGAAGLALTGVLAIVAGLATAQAEARQKAESYADTLEEGTRKVTQATRDMAKENLAAKGSFLWWENTSALEKADQLGLSLSTVTDAAMGNVAALKELKAAQAEYQAVADADRERGDTTSVDDTRLQNINAVIDAVKGENASIEDAIRLAQLKKEADAEATDTSQTAAEAYLEEAGTVEDLNDQISQLIESINEANGVNQDAISANIDYQNTLRDVDEQIANITNGVEGFGRGLDTTTEAGAANKAMLVGMAKDAWDAAAAQLELDGNTAGFTASLEASRQKLYDSAIAMGATEEEAAALRDSILSIPPQKAIDIIANTSFAQREIDSYISKNTGREIILKIGTSRVAQGIGGTGGITFATGGPVIGPGTATSDSIPARLSNGEHVLTAAEVQAAGGHGAVERWRQSLTRAGEIPIHTRTAESSQPGTAIATSGWPKPWSTIDAQRITIGALA